MASDIEVKDSDAPDAAPARRIPDAVWINRPGVQPRGARLAARVLAAAIVLGFVALAMRHAATESLDVVPSASAATDAGGAAGNGPTGYFPDRFDRRRLAPAEQPATF